MTSRNTGRSIVRKTLEALSAYRMSRGFSLYESVTFTDGSVIKNLNVDSAIDERFTSSLGTPGVAYVTQKFFSATLVYAIEQAGVLRVGVLKGYRSGVVAGAFLFLMFAGLAIISIIGGGTPGLVFAAIFGAIAAVVGIHEWRMISVLIDAGRLRRQKQI